jgi:hypothetical protein
MNSLRNPSLHAAVRRRPGNPPATSTRATLGQVSFAATGRVVRRNREPARDTAGVTVLTWKR